MKDEMRDGSLDLNSYRLITWSSPVESDYEGEPVFCHCKMRAPKWSSWTTKNPGRRFYGCSRYPVKLIIFYVWFVVKLLKLKTFFFIVGSYLWIVFMA
ncbi:hypothetical protein REPUB_Repub09cG0045800 [Reevesia pubescens]